ncbi:phenylalanine--tRNA ligase subunit alpha [Candidatus Microgenomates bacterium]|nr:phenylalanine--tRNA ligase subunit alpha [Candidatus Microgenomates bacterium]
MKEDIVNLKNELVSQIIQGETLKDLEQLESAYLGRNGKLTELIKGIKDVSPEDKKEYGILVNETKTTLLNLLSEQKNKLKQSSKTWFDPTIPGLKPKVGTKHLVTQAIEDIATIFEKIGFTRVRYPEVEWDWYAFESLNMPKEHPARDEWETFFVDAPTNEKLGKMILTPHTSSGQVREMHKLGKPPIRMINIAKTYRRQSDTTHSQMFHQFEGLVVDKGINISHLKGTIDYFAREFFGEGAVSRIRPFHFQFTEPSFEVDFSCIHCGGKGCKFCKSGWHEVGGAGMVHPNVLKAGGIDPNEYTGFAFGWGVERVRLLKSGTSLDDIRDLYTTDVRLLSQF